MSRLSVKTDDQKYEYRMEDDGSAIGYRYGEPCVNFTGDKIILTFAQDLESTREKLANISEMFTLAHGLLTIEQKMQVSEMMEKRQQARTNGKD
ncbi:MAG TPA: hypothetical protein DDY18_04520 [Flavobacterium sp.]|jgi:hypothetical protein|nr:hypothetical protein [Flavobacterium sp.]